MWPRQLRGIAGRLSRLSACSGFEALGERLEGSAIRSKLGNKSHTTYETYREFCETRPAEVVANIALCLIHQTNYLLDQQIRRLEKDFLKEGGLRERMTRAGCNTETGVIGRIGPMGRMSLISLIRPISPTGTPAPREARDEQPPSPSRLAGNCRCRW